MCFGGIGINGHIAFNEALDYWELMSDEAFKKLPTRGYGLPVTPMFPSSFLREHADVTLVVTSQSRKIPAWNRNEASQR